MPPDRDFLSRVREPTNDALTRVRVRSVVHPLLWACGVVTVPLYGLAPMKAGLLQFAMLGVGSLPVLGLLVAYGYWARHDPNRLHAEDYRVSRVALDTIPDKGALDAAGAVAAVAAASPVSMAEPDSP